MIDLHCHILPGIDDGPATIEGSLALAAELSRSGVHTVAATPHLREDHPAVLPTELGERCRSLVAELEVAGIDLAVVSGGEVDLVWALEASDAELRLASYGARGTDLLVETPYGPLLATFEGHLETLTARGFRVLLAHPERNPSFQRDPGRLAQLVDRGVLLQITTGALLRPPKRSSSGRLARVLLRESLAHVIASDAHGATDSGNGDGVRGHAWRALDIARELVGHAQVEWMVSEVPRAVLNGEPLPARPTRRTGRSPLGRWRRPRAVKGRFRHRR